jgi:hypothetical protein
MPSLTLPEIKALIPIDGEISDALLGSYSEIVTTEADLQLRNIFASPLPTVLEADCYNYKTYNTYGSRFISVTAWQPTALVIKKIFIEKSEEVSLTETPLVFGTDYVFFYGKNGQKIPGINQPVTNIRLINCSLSYNERLRLSGTYGWQAGYPGEIKKALAQVIVDLAGQAQQTAEAGGTSIAFRIKNRSVEKEINPKMVEKQRSEAENLLSSPDIQDVFNSYLNAGQETISTIC